MNASTPRYNGQHNLETMLIKLAQELPSMIPGSLAGLFDSRTWGEFGNSPEGKRMPSRIRFSLNDRIYVGISLNDRFDTDVTKVIDEEGNLFRKARWTFEMDFTGFSSKDAHFVQVFAEKLAACAKLAQALEEEFGGFTYELMSTEAEREQAFLTLDLSKVVVLAKEQGLLKGMRKGQQRTFTGTNPHTTRTEGEHVYGGYSIQFFAGGANITKL